MKEGAFKPSSMRQPSFDISKWEMNWNGERTRENVEMNRRFVDRPSSIIDLPRLTALISRVARARKKDELPHSFALRNQLTFERLEYWTTDHCGIMSVIGSLIFCTDCGNLLRESTGDANAILHCDVCGTRNKGDQSWIPSYIWTTSSVCANIHTL